MAFLAPVVWEVRTTATAGDVNGGGFDSVSGVPGTDFSQQDAAQITYTDLIINAVTNTQCTSALNPFTSAHVGNIINVTSGTGFTVQRVQIISVAAGVATCDKSLGTLSSTLGNGKLGGALLTPFKVAGLAIAGHTIYIKASGTYVSTIGSTNAASVSFPITWIGYSASRGDGGQATIQLSTSGNLLLFTAYHRIFNVIADCNLKAASLGIGLNSGGVAVNCKAINFTSIGFFNGATYAQFFNCVASGGTSAASAAFSTSNNAGMFLYGCRATGNACPGFQLYNASYAVRCISDNNTGASSDGFQFTGSQQGGFISCVSYSNGRDGIQALSNFSSSVIVLACILAKNGRYGLNNSVGTLSGLYAILCDYNAYYLNTSGPQNAMPAGAHDVALSGDPFTNGASNDFSLNATAGAGAACRAAGFPGALQSGGTGALDIGALQHADPAAVGAVLARIRTGF